MIPGDCETLQDLLRYDEESIKFSKNNTWWRELQLNNNKLICFVVEPGPHAEEEDVDDDYEEELERRRREFQKRERLEKAGKLPQV